MSTPPGHPRPTASYIKTLRDREAEKAAEKAAASLAYASPCSIQPVDDQSSVRVQQHIFACFQRKAESVEERMFELSTYELAAPPLKKLPGSHLEHPPDGDVNSNLKAGGGRRDVDAELQEKHGYTTTSLPLPKSGLLGTRLCAPADGVTVLLHPKERKSEVAVLWVPGFGRYADHMEPLRSIFLEEVGADLCGIDPSAYGRAYRRAADEGHAPLYNMLDGPVGLECIGPGLDKLGELGYTRIVLWANSTQGLTVTTYLTTLRRPPAGLEAVVLTSPYFALNTSSAFGLSNQCGGGYCILKTAAALLRCIPDAPVRTDPLLTTPKDAEPVPADQVHRPTAAGWLDEAALAARVHRFDRYLNPQRGKPYYAGWFSSVLRAQQYLLERFPPCGYPLNRCNLPGPEWLSCLSRGPFDARITTPALLFTVPFASTNPDKCAGIIDGVDHRDPNIDPAEVRAIFPRVYANGKSYEARASPTRGRHATPPPNALGGAPHGARARPRVAWSAQMPADPAGCVCRTLGRTSVQVPHGFHEMLLASEETIKAELLPPLRELLASLPAKPSA